MVVGTGILTVGYNRTDVLLVQGNKSNEVSNCTSLSGLCSRFEIFFASTVLDDTILNTEKFHIII